MTNAAVVASRTSNTPLIDTARIQQVLFNLLDNALKFTPKGGSVSLEVEEAGDDVLLHVRDTGIGLTPQQQSLLFRPFAQVHGEQERKRGTGLGLFICKGIVEQHGGRIWIDSEGAGTGSTFHVALPRGKVPDLTDAREPGDVDPAGDGADRPTDEPNPQDPAGLL